MKLKSYKFSKEFKENFKEDEFKDYPIVYILNSKTKAYIGETTNVVSRMYSHLNNSKRKDIDIINLILSEEFNQSATYNIETNLINHFIAEGKYELQNISQTKQKVMHNYKDKKFYDQVLFKTIWDELLNKQIVSQTIEQIENKDIFKISPYKSLSVEQAEAKLDILDFCRENLRNNTKGVYVVQGEAGTGKSVLISSLYNTIQDFTKFRNEEFYNTSNYLLVNHNEMLKTYHDLSKKLPNLSKNKILKPTSFVNKLDNADIVIVDEAHLLLSSKDPFNNYYGKNHLIDIVEKSKITILIFDPKQYLKVESYWNSNELDKILRQAQYKKKTMLLDQLRMGASNVSIDWINSFIDKKIDPIPNDDNYIIKPFYSAKAMYDEIKQLNKKEGLCRVVSTFDFVHKKDNKEHFIEIDDFKLPWNNTNNKISWAENECTIDEVGSIYTIQGFDLNYVGVILGPSVKYDVIKGEIYIDIDKYKDKKAFAVPSTFKHKNDINKIKEQIILNSMNILMKRGIKGLYIYAYDAELRKKLMDV